MDDFITRWLARWHAKWVESLRRHPEPYIIIDGYKHQLHHHTRIRIMGFTNTVGGAQLKLGIAFLDQNGKPMTSPQTPDAPPVWSNNSAFESLVVAADGMSAVATAVAPGSDSITVSLKVNGVTFSASISVDVAAPPQVLTSIQIVQLS